MDKTMKTERDSRLKLGEAHIYQHREASQLRDCRGVSVACVMPKARVGANKERQTYERFGF